MTPSPSLVEPTPITTSAVRTSPARIDWLQSAVAYSLLIGIIVGGLLMTGAAGPITSSDGAFSVKVPQGWRRAEVSAADRAKTVLALGRLQQTNGVQSEFVVGDFGHLVPLSGFEAEWQPFLDTGKSPVAGQFGPLTPTSVAGASALIVNFQGSKYGGQLLIVDYGSKTYIIQMMSDPSEVAQLQASDFAANLSSWEWR
jgi:hypothetical protein